MTGWRRRASVIGALALSWLIAMGTFALTATIVSPVDNHPPVSAVRREVGECFYSALWVVSWPIVHFLYVPIYDSLAPSGLRHLVIPVLSVMNSTLWALSLYGTWAGIRGVRRGRRGQSGSAEAD